MKPTSSIGIIFALIAVTLLVAGCASQPAGPAAPGTPGTPAAAAGNSPAVQKTKLSDTNLWKSAYLISGNTITPEAKTAMDGFDIVKITLPDGSTRIEMSSTNPEYKNQTYTLKQGQQLYFIEKFGGDDSAGQDFGLGDDSAVIVDADGYIVS